MAVLFRGGGLFRAGSGFTHGRGPSCTHQRSGQVPPGSKSALPYPPSLVNSSRSALPCPPSLVNSSKSALPYPPSLVNSSKSPLPYSPSRVNSSNLVRGSKVFIFDDFHIFAMGDPGGHRLARGCPPSARKFNSASGKKKKRSSRKVINEGFFGHFIP